MNDPFLEREYNARARRRDFDDLVADWVSRSKRMRAGQGRRLDLPYGGGERERMDIFTCGVRDAPTLVYVHGGYWQRHDKSIYSFVAQAFVDSGVNVAIPNYDLCPTVDIPHIVNQIRRALTWLWHNAEANGLDRGRINLSGHSAGGHLTAMMLTMDAGAPEAGAKDGIIRSAIPISGLYELAPLVKTSINDAVGIDEQTASACSPIRLVPQSKAPVMAALGGLESSEFHRQTEEFVIAWSGHGVEIVQATEPGVDHFDVINRLADPGSELFRRVHAWLR